ncbi:MAG: TraR/DksA C4-type zinc finger protein [Desulfocucumaceae bacterium]
MLTDEMKQKMKQRLLADKSDAMSRIEAINQGGLHESLAGSISELSMYDNHPADIGSEVFERSKDFALREDALHMASAIDDALYKIEKGTYGKCDLCGKDISLDRLEAIPYTTLCLDCKSEGELDTGAENRPVEEDVMEDVYARPFDDKVDNVEFDWEDSFQEVAGWNEHAEKSMAGSYYGWGEPTEEDGRGAVEDVESVPYEVGDDGVFYQSFRSYNDEETPRESIDVGFQHTERDGV